VWVHRSLSRFHNCIQPHLQFVTPCWASAEEEAPQESHKVQLHVDHCCCNRYSNFQYCTERSSILSTYDLCTQQGERDTAVLNIPIPSSRCFSRPRNICIFFVVRWCCCCFPCPVRCSWSDGVPATNTNNDFCRDDSMGPTLLVTGTYRYFFAGGATTSVTAPIVDIVVVDRERRG